MNLLDQVLQKIEAQSPMHGKRIYKFLAKMPTEAYEEIKIYVEEYLTLSRRLGISMDEVVDSYVQMVNGIVEEQFYFARENRYRYQSLKEVEGHVYHHERNMKAYMIGLALSQFLWENHYKMFSFFKRALEEIPPQKRYLEIGVGHGLFLKEAISSQKFSNKTAIDISKTSLQISQAFMEKEAAHVRWIHEDMLRFEGEEAYDFITMGEVLEHVEQPALLLQKVRQLLLPNGKAYISTCANAPVIDHIYLFRSVEEIQDMLSQAGLNIEKEFIISVDNIPQEKWQKKRANLTYAAIVGRN